MAKTLLSVLKFLVPSWLYEGPGGAVVKSHAMIIDEHTDRARAGLEARFPSRAQDDALTLIGEDRGIPRGRAETRGHYAQRLIAWRYPRGHRTRGSAFALLEQVSEYFGGVDCWTIDVKGNRHDRSADGTETFQYAYPWASGTATTAKGYFWIVLESSTLFRANPSFGDAALWGGALGTPGYALGQSGFGLDDADAIRGLFTGNVQWKPGGTLQQWLVINLDPSGPIPAPDVDWGNWSKIVSGTQVKSRYEGWRYVALWPALKQYTGRPQWCLLFQKPSVFTYGGVDTAWPATIPMPGGGTYAGNDTRYPTTITIPDDGDPAP